MFNHQFFSVSSRKKLNIELAYKAMDYARGIIPFESSFTQPKITDRVLLNKLYKEIRNNRKIPPNLKDSLYFMLVRWDGLDKTKTKRFMRKAKISAQENCGVLTYFANSYLKKMNVNRVERFSIAKSDHVFTVIDRAINSDINDIKTWGEYCIVLDTLNNEVYEPGQLYQKLKCYKYDKKQENPHILTPFTETNTLISEKDYTCQIDPEYNQDLLDEFLRRLTIIWTVLNDDYSHSNEVQQVMQKIAAYFRYTYNLQVSNFQMERMLDKDMRNIMRELAQLSDIDHEELYTDIIIKLSQLYNSFVAYFTELIYLETPLLHVMSHINEYENNVINELTEQLTKKFLNRLLIIAMDNKASLSVEVLLKNGADCTTKNKLGDTVLMWAIQNKKLNVFTYLLNNHKNLFVTRDVENLLPIHYVAIQGFYKAVPLILNQFKEQINVTAQLGKTPLFLSVREGNMKTFIELLKFGGHPFIADEGGGLPIHSAAINNRIEMLKILLEHYPELLNMQRQDGKTPLHLAAEKGHFEVVLKLLSRGALVIMSDQSGFLPLHLAVINGQIEVACLMLNHAVFETETLISFRTPLGWTALHLAAFHGHVELVKELLARGADPLTFTSNGLTAMGVAKTSTSPNQAQIINIIEKEVRARTHEAANFDSDAQVQKKPRF